MVIVELVDQQDELVRDRLDRDRVRIVGRMGGELGEPLDAQLPLVVELVDDLARHLHDDVAGVQEIRGDVVVLEVLGGNPERVALHARVDVLRDEDRALAALMQLLRDREDAVVGLVEVEREVAASVAARDADRSALVVPHDALEERALRAQPVERARDLTGVPPAFVVVLLERVELLDHREGNDHLVLGELEDRVRVVEEHVRVEHEVLAKRVRLAPSRWCAEGFRRSAGAVLVQHASPPMAGTALNWIWPCPIWPPE